MDRTWIEVDLTALEANYRQVLALTDAKVTCVLKANAYGHGLVPVARLLADAGCRSFAVSCFREAEVFFRSGIPGTVLVMGTTEADQLLRGFPEGRLRLTAADFPDLENLEKAGKAMSRVLWIHLKIDTGFHRLGFSPDEETARQIAVTLKACPHLRVSGVYSHLSLITGELDEAQHTRLQQAAGYLKNAGVDFNEMHLCDSIGLVRYPSWHMDRVRVGAFLYGVRPSRTEHMNLTCQETLIFRTRVAQVRTVPAGDTVGYGEDRLEKETRIATLCAGYGDGYPRRLSRGRGMVEIRGVLCPTVGLVCMDQMMVDVSAVPDAAAGDTATLLGGKISYGTFADWADTNRNEILAALSDRPVRRYLRDGQEVGHLDVLLDDMVLWD